MRIFTNAKKIAILIIIRSTLSTKIVYLVPDETKHINSNSTSRPVDYPEDLPEELPMKPKVMTFHTDIPKWLGECMKGLPAENTPLRNLIAQYIEYCKQL